MSTSNDEQNKQKSLTEYIQIFLLVVMIGLVLTLQFWGYYNRVYYSITIDGQLIGIGKTNEMTWKQTEAASKQNWLFEPNTKTYLKPYSENTTEWEEYKNESI